MRGPVSIRGLIGGAGVGALVAAALASPSLAARCLSADGVLTPLAAALIRAGQLGLAGAGLALLAAAWRWAALRRGLGGRAPSGLLLQVLVAGVLGVLIVACAYAYFDAVSMFQDIGDEACYVWLMAAGQRIYHDFAPPYGLLGYLPIAALAKAFLMDADDAYQLGSIAGVLVAYALSALLIARSLNRQLALFLACMTAVTVFSFTHENVLLVWRINNLVALVVWLLFLALLVFEANRRWWSLVVLGSALTVLAAFTKPLSGFVMAAALVLIAWGRTLARPRIWSHRLMSLLATGALVGALAAGGGWALWQVLVRPSGNEGSIIDIVASNARFLERMNEHRPLGLRCIPVWFSAAAGSAPGWSGHVMRNFGFVLNLAFKLVLAGVALSYVWRELRKRPPAGLSRGAPIALAVLGINAANLLMVNHSFHAAVDLVLTTVSLAIVCGLAGVRYGRLTALLLVALSLFCLGSYGKRTAAAISAKRHYGERIQFHPGYACWIPAGAEAEVWQRFYRELADAMPDAPGRRIWVIDEQSFLYYFLNTPVRVMHPLTLFGAIEPGAPGYSDYTGKLASRYFDYIVVGDDKFLFGRFGASKAVTVNAELRSLIERNYRLARTIQSPESNVRYDVWEPRLAGG